MKPPSELSAFLEWVRATTEAGWDASPLPSLATRLGSGVGGFAYPPGTRWKPLSAGEMGAVEGREGPLPPSLRMYLSHLGGTDRPMVGAAWKGAVLEAATQPGFYDWRRPAEIAAARAAVVDGLWFDISENNWWPAVLGERPATGARVVLEAALRRAPLLWPLCGHRFLVDDAVLSIHQSDVIVWGASLRLGLLRELGLGPVDDELVRVPFWGDLS